MTDGETEAVGVQLLYLPEISEVLPHRGKKETPATDCVMLGKLLSLSALSLPIYKMGIMHMCWPVGFTELHCVTWVGQWASLGFSM